MRRYGAGWSPGWNGHINRVRKFHKRAMASKFWPDQWERQRYAVRALGITRNPLKKPLLHKGRKP